MAKRRSSQVVFSTGTPDQTRDSTRTASSSATASASTNGTKPNRPAVLAVLVYLCGDDHIKKSTNEYLNRMLGFRPGPHLHLAVQYDNADEAKRFVGRAGDTRIQEDPLRRDVNTGDPRAFHWMLSFRPPLNRWNGIVPPLANRFLPATRRPLAVCVHCDHRAPTPYRSPWS